MPVILLEFFFMKTFIQRNLLQLSRLKGNLTPGVCWFKWCVLEITETPDKLYESAQLSGAETTGKVDCACNIWQHSRMA